MIVTLSKRFGFEAAHFLPNVPDGHRCRRMHGHSFRFEVALRGPIDPDRGWFLDYGDLGRLVRPLVDQLDHNLLNAVPGLENPTAENLSRWLWERLAPVLPGLCRVSVFETCVTRCDYEGPEPA
ncbi:MAG: 6-carboxytetrahydropterin synthase QueD [Candidatus Eisenbacteria bacterium]|nr:6-carboxytetrahydropterin synthase QueD [Candidatus Eisenbacteria bacterium]MCC7143630.1 6-carboxytetrahydropterin synthase QueD [Candidatus Eisenbacteria bacterium]